MPDAASMISGYTVPPLMNLRRTALIMTRIAGVIALLVLAGSSLSALCRAAKDGSSSAQSNGAKRNLTIDDYFRIKDVSDPQISPEGDRVADVVAARSLKDDKNHARIWMIPSAGGQAIPLTAEDVSSSHPRWSPDGKYLA